MTAYDVGIVGLGAMGQLIVPRLLNAGHKVTGWNRSRDKAVTLLEAGMLWAEHPREVAEQSDVVFSIVTDAKAGKAQTTCPVMGGKIDKNLYVDVEGKRIYVCCGGCVATVKKDPAKYVKEMEAAGITLEKVPVAAPAAEKKP